MTHDDPLPAPPAIDDPALDFMRLIWAVDHELQSVSKRMETALGLTVPQRMTLLLVGRRPGILAGEVAALLHLHPGTISGIVGRLESAGLVTRTGDAEDGRRLRLMLTADGRAANRRRTGTFEAAVRQMLASTRAGDVAAADRVLRRLANALREVSRNGARRATTPAARSRRSTGT